MKNWMWIASIFLAGMVWSGCLNDDCTTVDNLPEFETWDNSDSLKVESELVVTEATFDSLTLGKSFIVNDSASYAAFKTKHSKNCSTCKFPNIDFSKRTLLGYYLNVGCKGFPYVGFTETSANNYLMVVKFIDESVCTFATCQVRQFVWVSVLKLPANANVSFQEARSYQDCNC